MNTHAEITKSRKASKSRELEIKKLTKDKRVPIPWNLWSKLWEHAEMMERTVKEEVIEILELGIQVLELHHKTTRILKEQVGYKI